MYKIWIGSDNLLKWSNFTNKATGAKITSGTVTAKLYDDKEAGGPTQLGATITLTHTSVDGNWSGTIQDTHADLVDGMMVRVEVTADGGGDLLRLASEVVSAEVVS